MRSKLGAALSAIDPPLADLVCRMLEYDHALRPTPEEAREHPFFKPLNPARAIRDAFPAALGGLPCADVGAERTRPAFADELMTSGRNGLAEANGPFLEANRKTGFKAAPFQVEDAKYGAQHVEFAEEGPGALSHKRGGPRSNGSLVEQPPLWPARKRRSVRGAEVPAEVADDVTADVTNGAGRRGSLVIAPARQYGGGAAAVEAPTRSQAPGEVVTSARGVRDAESVSAAQLKSTPLKSKGTERLLGRAKTPPFCSTGWSLGGQVAASFEAGVGPSKAPGFAVKVRNGWKGRENAVLGSGTLPGSQPVEAAGLEPVKQTQEELRWRPVALHTGVRTGVEDNVNTPGEVSFAASLVARQGADALLRREELDRGRNIAPDKDSMALENGRACGLSNSLTRGRARKGTDESADNERFEAPVSGTGFPIETQGLRSGRPKGQELFVALEPDACPRSRGLRARGTGNGIGLRAFDPEPVEATAVVRPAVDEVAMKANQIELRERGEAEGIQAAPSKRGGTEGVKVGLASGPLLSGGALAEPLGLGLDAGGCQKSHPVKGAWGERPTVGNGGPPDSDSCGSAVLSSPPSGEKRLNEVGGSRRDGEFDSPVRGGRIVIPGIEPAASEMSLTAGPCRETRAKRKREGDPPAKREGEGDPPAKREREGDPLAKLPARPRGTGGVGDRERRILRRGGVEKVEEQAGVRTRAANRSEEGRDETPPLQRQRVLPRRPVRDEKSMVPWWIAVPPNCPQDLSEASLELL